MEELKNHGATDVIVLCAHALMSKGAWQRLEQMAARANSEGWSFQVIGTNTVYHRQTPSWYNAFPLENLVARVITNINSRGSVTQVQDHR